jgi:predicted small lipoprotein YifL
MNRNRQTAVGLAFLAILLLSGCGLKGDLYVPEPASTDVTDDDGGTDEQAD